MKAQIQWRHDFGSLSINSTQRIPKLFVNSQLMVLREIVYVGFGKPYKHRNAPCGQNAGF
jgi:hypothetical protein